MATQKFSAEPTKLVRPSRPKKKPAMNDAVQQAYHSWHAAHGLKFAKNAGRGFKPKK